MAAIDQFLKDHPELQDKDPARVADFVYKTQGFEKAGKDRARFDEFFLGKAPGPEPGFMEKVGDVIQSGVEWVGDKIQGNAEFPNAPSVSDTSSQAALAGVMGGDEDWANAIQKERPGSEIFKDKNDYYMIRNADGTEEYVNTPGLDKKDIARFAGKIASFIPAGKATTAAAGVGLGTRAAVGATTAGLTDAGMQALSGKDEIDMGQVNTTAALGAGGEVASRAVGGALRWAKSRYGNSAWRKMSDVRKGQVIARKAEIDNLSQEQYKILGKLDKLDQTDDAKIAEAMFGFKQTRGQAMPEGIAKTKQLDAEELLMQMPEGNVLKQQVKENYENLAESPGKFADMFSDGARLGKTRNESAELVQSKLVQAKEEMEAAFKATYKEAADSDVNYMDAAVLKIPDYLRKVMEAKDDVLMTPTGTPKTMEALDHVEKTIKEWTKDSHPLDKDKFTVGLRKMEQLRKDLNQLMRQTSKIDGGDDRRVLRMVQKELMGVTERMGDASLFKGDPQGIKLQKSANKMFADYAKSFRDRGKVGKIIQDIVDDDARPEDVARYLFGANGLGGKAPANAVQAYKRIVGKDSEALSALKETFFYANVRGKGENALGPQAMVKQIEEMLYKKGESTVKALYDDTEIASMKKFIKGVNNTFDMRGSSQSAERGARFYQAMARMVPGPLSFVFQAITDVAATPIKKAKAVMATQIPKKVGALPQLPSTLPATGAYSTSN